jgi:hypothetical protein
MIDTKELRQLAQAATPGPWILLPVGDKSKCFAVADINLLSVLTVVDECGTSFGAVYLDGDAKFIAAANPAAVSELLDRLEAAESVLKDFGTTAQEVECWLERYRCIEREAEALRTRLEAAESDAIEQARLNGMGSEREAALMAKLEAAEKSDAESIAMYRKARDERDALRAKIEEMEKQKPVAWRTFNGEGGYGSRSYADNENYQLGWAARNPNHVGVVELLYLAPGAQPKLDEIKIALQRALELGKRETWTGARKHRSREAQREEQQCWNKVWELLDAKGE